MPPYLRRVPPEVLVIILYFTSIGVDVETSSEIIRLKHRGYELSPQECQQRIDFTRGEYFPKVSLPWTLEGIAQEIPKHVTRDTFLSLAETDGDCEKLFSKQKKLPLDGFLRYFPHSYSGHTAQVNPALPNPWKEDAADPFLD